MGYTLADDEVALVLRPIKFDDSGTWSGLISTGLAMGPKNNKIDEGILNDLIGCATFLSAFLDIAHEYPDIMRTIEERREQMIEIFKEDVEEEANGLPEVQVKTSSGNVIQFGPTTKTKGSA
tara:strand:+ start:123 stop:488 length:366 start_codon:yes stop_codon:yes gene_type:complete